ncbi:Dolichyl-diphosphooligosaccharide--protein glycosyltransferase subunit 2 [Pseudocercospora fuligena]|uniref:Dolichyl-diphosphooligosaccharide--protein glycosyltransferase subunit 2 n=1 Tax=Pseudocercospora fuligena TaxID=685502 RepID=A0A8H6RLQ5_9PEZI|nr:Dolichyl-diphosphooligosaccharide--protein glycosyltransferase subunit 2 [Pseudocercospora fuligena]
MKVLQSVGVVAAAFCAAVSAASAWTFDAASLTVTGKAAEGAKQSFSPSNPLGVPVLLPASSTLKVLLTAQEGKAAKRPHQAFLTLREEETGLEESFAFSVKDNGKAKLDISQKDLPFQFLTTSKPIQASVVLASFGSSTPYAGPAFQIKVQQDPTSAQAVPAPPERYTAKPEIHHIFKDDPRSPPTVVSLFFTLAILATVPVLLGGWVLLGGNVEHMGKAFGANPVAHGLFFGSIVAMEAVFFLYYTSWNLFQTLPAASILGVVAFVSGSRALTEVQERRLAGQR